MPQDEQGHVKCDQCGATYHKVHWSLAGQCLNCNCKKTRPFQVDRVAPLRVTIKDRAIPITPSAIVYVDNKGQAYDVATASQRTQHFGQVVRAFLLAELLIAIATVLGAFAYRLALLREPTIQLILRTVLTQVPPNLQVFVAAFMAGNIAALVFYPPLNSPKASSGSSTAGRRFTYLIAGIIAVASLDLLLLDLDPQGLVQSAFAFSTHIAEILCAQAATVMMVALLTPLHRRLASITSLPAKGMSQRMKNIYGWTRVLIVALLLDIFFAHLTTYKISIQSLPELVQVSLGPLHLTLTSLAVGAFLCGLGWITIAYRPPKFREVTWHLGIVRLLLFIGCVAVLIALYSSAVNKDTYLGVIVIAGIGMLLATPVQRALS